ncbi:MAG TPA: hypothetical protein VJB92_02450 [Candidatus Paceibacterota bacterium]
MAIVFEQPKKPFNWTRFLFVIFIIAFLVFGTYYLFFAPSPRLDIVLPPPLERARQISNLEFVDPATVLGSPAFRRLKSYVGPPAPGPLGRPNPFARF